MANYTVFGSGTPAYTLTPYTDGSPNITLGNYFYTYGSNVAGWRCRGGRVYIPNSADTLNRSITIMAWVSTTSPVDLSTTPLKSVVTTTPASEGWAEVLWDAPFTISPGDFVFIGYAFDSPREHAYIHAPSPSITFIRSSDNVDLAFAEPTINSLSPATYRARFRIGTAATDDSQAWYGVDIMVDDGEGALPTPIAEYGFNETSGTTVADSSGNNRDLTVNSASNLGVGKTGNGLHQVGGGLPNRIINSAAWLETSYRTMMFWGRRGSEGASDWSSTVYMDEPSGIDTAFGISLNNNNNEVRFQARRGSANYPVVVPEVSMGTWAHYAITYDQLKVRAYIDGVFVGENDLALNNGPLNASDGNLYLYGGDYQQQIIDDLRFFDVALSEAQIQEYMNLPIDPPDTEPPSVPANVQATVNYQHVVLNWDDSTDNVEVQNYIVYRSATSGFVPGPGNQEGGPGTSTYQENAPVGTWYYRVAARDEVGNISAASAEIEVVTTQAPVVENYLFPSDLGWSVGSDFSDTAGSGWSVGVICALSGPSYISGGRFYSPVVKTGAEVRLFANGVQVAVKTGLNLSVGWNELLFDSYYVGASGVDYLISVFLPAPNYTITNLPNAFPGTTITVGPMYSTLLNGSRFGGGSGMPGSASSSWFGVDIIAPNIDSTIDPTFGTTVALENAKQGNLAAEWSIDGAGDVSNLGFARQFSVDSGETVEFSCDGNGVDIDVYRIGYYGGLGWRKVASLTNTATDQPDPDIIPNSNGGVTCSNWSVTATWDVPAEALSGLYVGVYRNLASDNASYIPFIVRNDTRAADVAYKTADSTWGLAYNYYGTPASPFTGKSLYGSGGPLGSIGTRAHAATYHKPIVTREGISQTYWLACEAPLIRFLERNGIEVKYIASKDLDEGVSVLANTNIMVSSGHDEYWSIGMRDNAEAYRDAGGNLLFFSGNEVFWRTRFEPDRNTMWCYKDTASGPASHVPGTPLDPVTWTGTWKDTRFPGREPENLLTGTDFRMNGVNDYAAPLLQTAGYASHPFWRNSALLSGNVTAQGIIGFEADSMLPAQPAPSTAILAAHTLNIDGKYADDNGQEYAGNGDLNWGVISQRYASGAVVVGFGTCQWAWALDPTHDRGGNYVQPALQQATLNLFADLGAAPATIMAGMTLPVPVSLDNYGVIPTTGRSGKVKVWDGADWTAHPLKVWDGTQWVTRPVSGSEDGSTFTLGKD